MKIENLFEKLNSEDYQNRGGDYPKSDVPVSINCSENKEDIEVEISFKSTTMENANSWVESSDEYNLLQNFAKENGYSVEVNSYQDGDYENDWIATIIKLKKEEQNPKNDTQDDIPEEIINIKSKQELLKTLEEIIAHFDKWKFFQKWKCPTDPQKQTALIMINSFRKKFVWENKKYDVEFKVVITDRDTSEPKLMVFKTTLIDNVKMNITALKQLWDEVANEKKTINNKAYNNIYESIADKLRVAVEDRKKGEFLKPEVVKFDPKIGSTVVNEVEDENIISIKLDYWILFRDLEKIDDKTIYSITDRLMENISFSK